jgi:hypothetical protein
MAIEQAMLAYARPHVLAGRARSALEAEQCKGCLSLIAPGPVALEPPYTPLGQCADIGLAPPQPPWHLESPPPAEQLTRMSVWIAPDQPHDWNRSERFLKHLCSTQHRVAFEIVGNARRISIQLLCYKADAHIVANAFGGEFECCGLSDNIMPLVIPEVHLTSQNTAICDLHPPPPYFHLLTSPEELRGTLFSAIATSLASLPTTGVGVYQAVFQSVNPDHDWHANVQALYNLEYAVGLVTGTPTPQRTAQQVPSGELHDMSEAVVTKAHNNKPFYGVAVRVGLFGVSDAQNRLTALASFGNLIQSGGRPLCRLPTGAYAEHRSYADIARMFQQAIVYRCGFLANSHELISFVHVPPAAITQRDELHLKPMENLRPKEDLSKGTLLGYCDSAGDSHPICVPAELRSKHIHTLGRTGCGKSTLIERMVIQEIMRGEGVAVFDPHGLLVKRLLRLIPVELAHRIIYANPGDPEHTLLWNPLRPPAPDTVPGMDRGRVADDIVSAFKSFVTGWGDRLEHLLRHSIAAIMKLPDGTLRDVADLLRRESKASETLRQRILAQLDDDFERQFWLEDFDNYANSDIHPPQHKLSKLLASAPVRRMLSQPDSAFSLRDIMDSGKILLLDLSTVGSETRDILGCFFLSLLHLAALSRSSATQRCRAFHIFCDEAHRFLTDAMEDLIAETRKFDVSLTLAHQNLSQFADRKVGALSNVGTTVLFDIDGKDAHYLLKDMLGKVEETDLVGQPVGHAVARIGSQVVRIRTADRLPEPAHSAEAGILDHCYRHYYRPVEQPQPPKPLPGNGGQHQPGDRQRPINPRNYDTFA